MFEVPGTVEKRKGKVEGTGRAGTGSGIGQGGGSRESKAQALGLTRMAKSRCHSPRGRSGAGSWCMGGTEGSRLDLDIWDLSAWK